MCNLPNCYPARPDSDRIRELDGPILLINLDGTSFRHGSTYDLEGRVIMGPAERPLRVFETVTSNDRVDVVVMGHRRDGDVQE